MILQNLDSSGYILVPLDVIRTMESFIQTPTSPTEAGGIFIGYYRGIHIEVVSCTTPYPRDQRTPILFDRKDPRHQKEVLKHWKSSGNTLTYVGEWHTHPENVPTPSSRDLKTWKNIIHKHRPFPIFFLICGSEGKWCGQGKDGLISSLINVDEAV